MKRTIVNVGLLFGVFAVICLSVWGPETLARYQDRRVLNEIHTQAVEGEGEGYRYTLNGSERVFLLSQCLNSQNLPESEWNARFLGENGELSYQNVGGTYAFVQNRQGPSGKEITGEEIYKVCNEGIKTFQELGILPDSVRAVDASNYEVTLYSAIDVLEPRNHIAVWKVSLSDSRKNADKSNRLIDAYIDADNGRIYEFYARTELGWDQIVPDDMVEAWREYAGLGQPQPYPDNNPLLETTPFYKKYLFDGMEGEHTVATVGFYEGINELFIKIAK